MSTQQLPNILSRCSSHYQSILLVWYITVYTKLKFNKETNVYNILEEKY